MSPPRELFLAPQYPTGKVPPVSEVRSTLLSASLQGVRQMGLEDRYFAALAPERHEQMRLLIPGVWVSLETAEAHYSACDAMELSNDETIEMGRSVLMRTQKTFLGTVGSVAAGAGATPWHLYRYAHRIWGRIFNGGDHVIYKVGPKDLDIGCAGCPLLRIQYFRTAVRAYYSAIASLVASSVHCRELPERRSESSITMRISWV